MHLNAPDFKPECSLCFGGLVDYIFDISSLPSSNSLEYFNSHLDDVFVNAAISNEKANVIINEKSGGSETIQGETIELQMLFDNDMDLEIGFTVQSSKFDDPEQLTENEVKPGSQDIQNCYIHLTDEATSLRILLQFMS